VLVGFRIANTLSEHGAVSRGVCNVQNGVLKSVTERTHIERKDGVIQVDVGGAWEACPKAPWCLDEHVGLHPRLVPAVGSDLHRFPARQRHAIKIRMYIPSVVDQLITSNRAVTDVRGNVGALAGMTYPEDKPLVKAGIQALINAGEYPAKLWS
jgi:hypothetical protein